MYFAFLNSFANSTMLLSLLSILTMICGSFVDWQAYMRLLGLLGFFASCVWAPWVVVFWKRRSKELVQEWGMQNTDEVRTFASHTLPLRTSVSLAEHITLIGGIAAQEADISPFYNAKRDPKNDHLGRDQLMVEFGIDDKQRQFMKKSAQQERERCPNRTRKLLRQWCWIITAIACVLLVCMLVTMANFGLLE